MKAILVLLLVGLVSITLGARPKLVEVFADLRTVSRYSHDPVTLQPRQDVFDLVYLSAYFDQPLYVTAKDKSKYRVEDLWTKTEAQHLASLVELRCPVPGQAQPRTLRFVSSQAIYPSVCLRHPSTSSHNASMSDPWESQSNRMNQEMDLENQLAVPMPQHRWLEQVFAGTPTGPSASHISRGVASSSSSSSLYGDMIINDPTDTSIGPNVLPLIFVARHYTSDEHAIASTLTSSSSPSSSQRGKRKMEPSYISQAKRCAIDRVPKITIDDLSSCELVFKGKNNHKNTPQGSSSSSTTSGSSDSSSSSSSSSDSSSPGIVLSNFRGQKVKAGLSSLIQVQRQPPVKLWTVAGAHIDELPSGSYDLAGSSSNNNNNINNDNNINNNINNIYHRSNVSQLLISRLRAREEECAAHVSDMRTAFIETNMQTATGIIKPVMDMLIGDLVDQYCDLVLADLSLEATANLANAIGGPMVDMVVIYSMKVVPRNITHRVSDFISDHMVRLLSKSIPNMVSGPLSGRVYQFVTPLIKEKLTRILVQTLPNHISYGLPELIGRALPILLTAKLTRSLTHSLVPSVARGVSITYHFAYLCFLCNHFRAHCSDCNHLQISQHQIQYYAAWYSEYYSGYYGDYYRDAAYMMQDLDYNYDSRLGESTEVPQMAIKASKEAAQAASKGADSLGGKGSEGYGGGTDTPGLAEPTGNLDIKPGSRVIPGEDTLKEIPSGQNWEHPFKIHEEAQKAAADSKTVKRWGDQRGGGQVGDMNNAEAKENNAMPAPELIE